MSFLKFDKDKLINLSYSLERELIRSNRRGAYLSTTIIRSNTRKYHGLLVAPQPAIDDELHVLLSSLDPTVVQHDASFNLGIHLYPNGVYSPKGHKYVREVNLDPIPYIIYRVGGVILKVEALFSSTSDRMMLRYTLIEAHSETKLQLRPYLAFRSRHALSKANEFANTKFTPSIQGVMFKLYQGYTPLYLQLSKKAEYIHSPNWYFDLVYFREEERGYESTEDLMVPGYFEFPIKMGESVVIAGGTTEMEKPQSLLKEFDQELKRRIPRDSFINSLRNSASQFIDQRDGRTEIVAGYPWFGSWGRDTLVALPGITLINGDFKTFESVLDTLLKNMNGPLIANLGQKHLAAYNSVDTSLWLFWTLQQYIAFGGVKDKVWKKYGPTLKLILRGYRAGTLYNINMQENGLVYAAENGLALTWMDAISMGKPVTARMGYAVEVNALAYNAIKFTLEMATEFKDHKFVSEFASIAEVFPKAFEEMFWNDKYNYLADYVNGDYKDWAIRPNMLFAVSLPFSPLQPLHKKAVLSIIERELLTIRGLRTLSPNHSDYEGQYTGNASERDAQYHQGTVWPWLMGAMVDAYLKTFGAAGLRKMEWHLEKFEEVMNEYGIASISEIYDGDPPHQAKGAISQAWSVAEVLRALKVVENFKSQLEKQ